MHAPTTPTSTLSHGRGLMGSALHWRAAIGLGCMLCALAGNAQAQLREATTSAEHTWLAVGNQTLDTLRGGFNMGNGLVVSFGITNAVFINGTLVTETTLGLGRLDNLTPAQATQLSQKLESLTLVQNGPGNTFVSGPGSSTTSPAGAGATATSIADSTIGTIIQNSLNNQHIRYQTVINASSNGLGMVRSSNLHNTVADAIQQSIGQR